MRRCFLSLPSCLGPYARYFRNCAVSLALSLHANVLDAPYLSSLIILKAADAAANQRNARYNDNYDIIAHIASVQDANFHWRIFSLSRADDYGVKIKCPPVHCLSGSSCSSPPRRRRLRFFCDSRPKSWRHSVLIRKRGTLASVSFSFSPPWRLNPFLRRLTGLRRKWWSFVIKFMSPADPQERARERLA